MVNYRTVIEENQKLRFQHKTNIYKDWTVLNLNGRYVMALTLLEDSLNPSYRELFSIEEVLTVLGQEAYTVSRII